MACTMRILGVLAAALALLLSAMPHGCAALYSSSSDVRVMSEKEFRSTVGKDDEGRMWLVEFYAPWCGHCKALAPEYDKVATALRGVVGVAAVDADKHKAVAADAGVQGFPTIKFYFVDRRDMETGRARGAWHRAGVTTAPLPWPQLGAPAVGGVQRGAHGVSHHRLDDGEGQVGCPGPDRGQGAGVVGRVGGGRERRRWRQRGHG